MTFKVLFGMTCKMPPSEMKYMKDKRFKGVGWGNELLGGKFSLKYQRDIQG